MSKPTLTSIEVRLLEQGYVSIRMAQAKTGRHQSTFSRAMKSGALPHTTHMGQNFLRIEDLSRWVGDTSVVDMRDWTDVVAKFSKPENGQ